MYKSGRLIRSVKESCRVVQGRPEVYSNGPGSGRDSGDGQEEMPDGGSIRYQQTLYAGIIHYIILVQY